jgi:hypothetical protein
MVAACLAATAAGSASAQHATPSVDSSRISSQGGSLVNRRASRAPGAVDGDMWLQSSREHRQAFLVGAVNMMALESAYARKMGAPSTAASVRAANALEHKTLDHMSDRITRWYEANPGRRNVPVVGVLWMDMVKADSSRK